MRTLIRNHNAKAKVVKTKESFSIEKLYKNAEKYEVRKWKMENEKFKKEKKQFIFKETLEMK